MKGKLRLVIIFVTLGATIALDQISKVIVRDEIAYHERIEVIPKYFTLTKIENSGAFLSLGNNFPPVLKTILLTILPVIVLAGCLYYVITSKGLSRNSIYALSLIVGGGVGNLYDRILYGSVTDFMHMDFVIFQTGIFNIADMAIMAGMFMILGESFLKRKKDNKDQEIEKAA